MHAQRKRASKVYACDVPANFFGALKNPSDMKPYLYLSLIPEALVASHLAPEEFGVYLSVGSQKRTRGQAMFFKLTDGYAEARLSALGLDPGLERDESKGPRRSAYLSIYRVLEQTPVDALESLHLVTEDGRVLTLNPAAYEPDPGPRFHLYQELCPITPRVVSTLEPRAFASQITDPANRVSLPALVFTELKLESLADDPEAKNVDNLPYPNLEHLRDCLRELRVKPNKMMKTVIRSLQQDVLYRTLRGGLYVATSGGGFRFFPMPPRPDLESTNYPWWRSALSTFGA
jgi:hypothetical protein